MRSVWLLALAASGCRSLLGIDQPARGDAGPDGFAVCTHWHPEGFDPCALVITADSLTLDGQAYIYNSGDGALTDAAHQTVITSGQTVEQTDGTRVAVLSVGRFTVTPTAHVTVMGPRPLLVVSWSAIVVDGALDAGSHLAVTDAPAHTAQTVQVGAGANQGCTTETGQDGVGASATGGSGGGGGGGFHGAGGPGGRGGGASPVAGGPGGQPAALTSIRGGCPGGASGAAGAVATLPAIQGSRALGGSGGGAIRLVALDSIEVRGAISVNGAGGAGAPRNSACGGGGGGAGGYLGFEAPLVALAGTITANGGGGGGGAGATGDGSDGGDGAAASTGAPGGAVPADCGLAGGTGGATATLDGAA
ncbi:MAG TPA: hypothetical protein VHW23_16230, partial [Kofleriaceae bacterium]|nr:hypothetical protein [Kofleriaceae bacterium]